MAVAAEVADYQTSLELMALEFPDYENISVIQHERPAAEEVYGRSLSTIYRLGAFAIGKAHAEVINSPESAQARAEFYTSVEEGFGTDLELGGGLEVRDFDTRPVIAGKVMARDLKTPVSDMTKAGLVCAEEKAEAETASGDYRFLPQLTRSKWDHENAVHVDQMVRGETTYNTRIVISPFPEEAAAESGGDYWRDIGYVPHLKRGFVQLYHSTGEGLIAGSLSFDGSDKTRLRQVVNKYGVEIPEGEITDNWLQYAVTDTLSESEAKELALELANQAGDPAYKKTTNTVDVTTGHREIMDRVFDESYSHACESLARGYQTPDARKLILQLADKAGNFNNRYATALYEMRADGHAFTDDNMVVLHELLVYSTIELMRAQHIKAKAAEPGVAAGSVLYAPTVSVVQLQALDPASFQNVLGGFGAEGARNNRTYSACGLSIAPGAANSSGENPQSAFGGKVESVSRAGEDKYGSLEFECPKCHRTNRRPRGKLIPNCLKCGADVRC